MEFTVKVNYPPNVADGGVCPLWEAEEQTAFNCDERCDYSHPFEAWLPETNKWYCSDCLALHFGLELRRIINANFCSGMLTEEHFERCSFIATTNDDDEFTGFRFVLPWAWMSDVVTISYRELIESKEKYNER